MRFHKFSSACRFHAVFVSAFTSICDAYIQYVRYEQNQPGNPEGAPDSPKIPWHAYKDPYEAIEMIQKCHKSQFVNEHLLRNAKNTVHGRIIQVLYIYIIELLQV